MKSYTVAFILILMSFFSVQLLYAGKIVGWGRRPYPGTLPGNDFIAISGQGSLAVLHSSGTLQNFGSDLPPVGDDYAIIDAGSNHYLAIRYNGSLAAWGTNLAGECNVPDGNNYVAIAGGDKFSVALRTDGSLVAWGLNNYGQCNVPSGNDYIAIDANNSFAIALCKNHSIVGWGKVPSVLPQGNDFVAIAAGANFIVALRSDGSLIGSGVNNEGQTNVPSGNDFISVACGESFALALKTDGSLVAWGFNQNGECNVPSPEAGEHFTTITCTKNAGFALQEPLKAPVVIQYPNDNTMLKINDNINIVWETREDISFYTMMIEYSTNKGLSWNLIGYTPNMGHYPWNVPPVIGDKYKIRISPVGLSNLYGYNKEPFKVFSCVESFHMPADLNSDCIVNIADLALLANLWLGKSDVSFYRNTLDIQPDWTFTGQWKWGRPLGLGGTSGEPDPETGSSGFYVVGVNLKGDYSTDVSGPYYVTTRPISCQGYENVRLRFYRWLNTDSYGYADATVEMSNDNVTWSRVWQSSSRSIIESSWQEVEYDISNLADNNPTVYIRWGYQIHPDAYAYSGWNIDDVELWGNEIDLY